jgi:hypothetical protein
MAVFDSERLYGREQFEAKLSENTIGSANKSWYI